MNAVLLEKWKGAQSYEPVKCRVPRHYDFCEKKKLKVVICLGENVW